jgi:tetrahydrodipicolinate N-succinyltransferase
MIGKYEDKQDVREKDKKEKGRRKMEEKVVKEGMREREKMFRSLKRIVWYSTWKEEKERGREEEINERKRRKRMRRKKKDRKYLLRQLSRGYDIDRLFE